MAGLVFDEYNQYCHAKNVATVRGIATTANHQASFASETVPLSSTCTSCVEKKSFDVQSVFYTELRLEGITYSNNSDRKINQCYYGQNLDCCSKSVIFGPSSADLSIPYLQHPVYFSPVELEYKLFMYAMQTQLTVNMRTLPCSFLVSFIRLWRDFAFSYWSRSDS